MFSFAHKTDLSCPPYIPIPLARDDRALGMKSLTLHGDQLQENHRLCVRDEIVPVEGKQAQGNGPSPVFRDLQYAKSSSLLSAKTI